MESRKSTMLRGSRPSSKAQCCHLLEIRPWRCHPILLSLQLLDSAKCILPIACYFLGWIQPHRLCTEQLHILEPTVWMAPPAVVQHISSAPRGNTGERSQGWNKNMNICTSVQINSDTLNCMALPQVPSPVKGNKRNTASWGCFEDEMN